jgi:hypothetical protein
MVSMEPSMEVNFNGSHFQWNGLDVNMKDLNFFKKVYLFLIFEISAMTRLRKKHSTSLILIKYEVEI